MGFSGCLLPPVAERVLGPFHQGAITLRYGLLLTPCPHSTDPLRPLYDIGMAKDGAVSQEWVRMISLGRTPGPLTLWGEPVAAQWKEIYIAHHPPLETAHTIPPHMSQLVPSYGYHAPFRFPAKQLEEFLRITPNIHLDSVRNPPKLPWDGTHPVTFTFTISINDWTLTFLLRFGCCSHTRSIDGKPEYTHRTGARWARVDFLPVRPAHARPQESESLPFPTHDCFNDHVRQWPFTKKSFASCGQQITITLARCPINPKDTFLVDISAQLDYSVVFGGREFLQYSAHEPLPLNRQHRSS